MRTYVYKCKLSYIEFTLERDKCPMYILEWDAMYDSFSCQLLLIDAIFLYHSVEWDSKANSGLNGKTCSNNYVCHVCESKE